LFIILTGIEKVYLRLGRPDQQEAPVLTVDEAQKHLEEGQFPPGSMGPKIQAAIDYIKAGGKEVLITKASHLKAALLGRSGTRIIEAKG
jgi:carbamate kinase